MWHDLAYSRTRDPAERAKADKELIEFAKRRMRASDANISERIASGLVSTLLTAKQKISGRGIMRKKRAIKKKKKRALGKISGFLSLVVLAGITAASHLLQTGSNLYRNYKLAKNAKAKTGSSLASKRWRRRKRRVRASYSLRLQRKTRHK